jgi:hypothetical protein
MESMRRVRRQYDGTHLFLVRLQAEELDEGDVQWYGRVQRVVNGETYTFSGWTDLVEHLLTMLPDLRAQHKDGPLTSPGE